MGKIELTNIIIDDFQIARRDTSKIYTHILTHIHTGSYFGMKIILRDCLMGGTTGPFTVPR